ncbi:hypothetical protein R6Q59_031991 [Mikania micrantha]
MDDLGCRTSTLFQVVNAMDDLGGHASTIDLASHIIRVALTLKHIWSIGLPTCHGSSAEEVNRFSHPKQKARSAVSAFSWRKIKLGSTCILISDISNDSIA